MAKPEKRFTPLGDVAGFVNISETMFAQKLDEFRYSTLFLRAQVVMDMPAEIILAELVIVFGAAANDVVQSVEAEILCVPKMDAQTLVIDATTQSPNGVDERQRCKFVPRRAKVINVMRWRAANEVNRGIANEQDSVRILSFVVGLERGKNRSQALLGEKHFQKVYAGQRRRI